MAAAQGHRNVTARPPERYSSGWALSLVLVSVLGLGACSTVRSVQQKVFGETPEARRGDATAVYYIGTGGTVLFEHPGKTVVTRLPEYRKVYRSRLERGYAYVRVDGTGEEGWVDNAKLIWGLPSGRAAEPMPSAPDAAEATSPETVPAPEADEPPAEVQPVAAPATETPPPAAPPAAPPEKAAAPGEPEPTKVHPSVFDPF